MRKLTQGMWMQSIIQKDGTRKRAFCLSCLQDGKDWIGGDLCEHFQSVETVGPTGALDRPLHSTVDADER
jgi:hypothetical protein